MTTDVTNPPPPPPPETLILGKFKDQAALETAYKALETKLGSQGNPPPPPPAPDPLNPPAVVGKDGLSIEKPAPLIAGNALEAAYAKSATTSLTAEDYTALAAQGFTKQTVDAHIEGRNSVFANTRNAVLTAAGGEQQYKTMITWAAANMPVADLDAFNIAVKSGNAGMMSLAVTGLTAKYRAAVGSEPPVLDANGSPGSSGAAHFANRAEFYKATGSKQYQTDPAFRAQVNVRLTATRKANPNF